MRLLTTVVVLSRLQFGGGRADDRRFRAIGAARLALRSVLPIHDDLHHLFPRVVIPALGAAQDRHRSGTVSPAAAKRA